jgi:hypothetical protein
LFFINYNVEESSQTHKDCHTIHQSIQLIRKGMTKTFSLIYKCAMYVTAVKVLENCFVQLGHVDTRMLGVCHLYCYHEFLYFFYYVSIFVNCMYKIMTFVVFIVSFPLFIIIILSILEMIIHI